MKSLKEQRRIEIIEAAIKVFGEYGYHKGKVEKIAEKAGIGKATVYEYFSSKKEIFQQMLRHAFKTYIEEAKKATLGKSGAKNKFTALLNYHWDFIDLHVDTIEQTFFQFKNISDEIKPYIIRSHKIMIDFLSEIIAEGMKIGEIRADVDKEKAALMILGVIASSNFMRYFSKNKEHSDIDAKCVVDALFEGLGGRRQ
ncbi:MAG: TetR/AcrR family transcriptional regulator [Clostridiales bacterium]|nr:TetR/AcrR family transcriptional regulator [Clostridiales bacterium]